MNVLADNLKIFSGDRIQWMAVLIVACFVSVLLLRSQSAASYPTYFLALLMLATFQQWRDVLKLNLMRWIMALLLWLCLSVLWSSPFEWREALTVWSRTLLVFCFVVAFAECQLRGHLQRWMGIALTIVGAGAVLAAIANFYITNPSDGRLNGLGQLDTHVIAALIYGVVLIFVLRSSFGLQQKYVVGFNMLIAVAISIAVALSGSRNAWVSVTIGVGVLVFAQKVKDARQFSAAVITLAFVLAIFLVVLAFDDNARALLLPRGDSHRIEIWTYVFNRFLDGFVLVGQGINTKDDVPIGDFVYPHPHNMYLTVLFQGGLVAVVLFFVVVVKVVLALLRNYADGDAKLALAVLALALSSYILDGHELIDKVGETWFLFWLPVGTALGLGWRKALGYR